jgi:hypothetical protein
VVIKMHKLNEWVQKLNAAIRVLLEQDFGYPLGNNEVRPPIEHRGVKPDALYPLYEVCDGLSLPDVHIGYFLDSAERLSAAEQRGEPTSVQGTDSFAVHVFGSDGGGGRFSLRIDDGSVYYLPSSGAVRDGRYVEDDASIATRLAASVSDFLWLLYRDVDAFVRDDQGHAYMVG